MTPRAPELNPPMRVGDEVIFWDGSARKLFKSERERLDRGETVKLAQPQPGIRSGNAVARERRASPSAAFWRGFQRGRRR